jgi:hypothetical protein
MATLPDVGLSHLPKLLLGIDNAKGIMYGWVGKSTQDESTSDTDLIDPSDPVSGSQLYIQFPLSAASSSVDPNTGISDAQISYTWFSDSGQPIPEDSTIYEIAAYFGLGSGKVLAFRHVEDTGVAIGSGGVAITMNLLFQEASS